MDGVDEVAAIATIAHPIKVVVRTVRDRPTAALLGSRHTESTARTLPAGGGASRDQYPFARHVVSWWPVIGR